MTISLALAAEPLRRARRGRLPDSRSASTSTTSHGATRRGAWRACTTSCSRPEPFDATTFPNDAGYDELVVARDIPFHSLCEHHLLPFSGVAHVGYLPGERIVGLSKLARVVDHFARALQVQERLTTQVAGWLAARARTQGASASCSRPSTCA